MKSKWVVVALIVLVVTVLSVVLAEAQGPTGQPRAPRTSPLGTGFTYQGQLKNNGTAVNGTCNLAFRLYDDPSAGNQIGNAITQTIVITNGLFTTPLDFGASAFNGDARWLDIRVSTTCPSTGGFTPLTTRQAITPAPYALHAADAWAMNGNSGTNSFTNFIGSTDNVVLTLRANNVVGWRLAPNGIGTPNLIGGSMSNWVTNGVSGATIGGGGASAGNDNRVTDDYGVIGGGYANRAGDNAGTTSDKSHATVGGGSSNTASGNYATVGGGTSNTAGSQYATVGGGNGNEAISVADTIGGGKDNTIWSTASTIAGGDSNNIPPSSDYATIGGGYFNNASNTYATVPGGVYAWASHYGEMAYASGQFSFMGDAQSSLYVVRNTTTNATQTELFLDGVAQRITIASGRTVTFDILVVARTTDGSSAGYRSVGVIENQGGNTKFVSLIPTVTDLGKEVGAWTVAVNADDVNDALVVKVTGSAATTIRWVATVRTVEVSY